MSGSHRIPLDPSFIIIMSVTASDCLAAADSSHVRKIHVYLATPKIQKALPHMRCALHRFSMFEHINAATHCHR
jgi:hypothetical protein